MQRVKRRIFSGVVCEQEVYTVSDRANIKKAEPRPRFKDDEERAQHRIGISKRKHQRLGNEKFSPLSLYSTLTFDDDSEVHTFTSGGFKGLVPTRRSLFTWGAASLRTEFIFT